MRFKKFFCFSIYLSFILLSSSCDKSSKSSFLFWCNRDELSSFSITIVNNYFSGYEQIESELKLIDGFISSEFDKKLQKITIVYDNTLSKSTNYKSVLTKNGIIFE